MISVFDSRGKVVEKLIDQPQSAGYYQIMWHAAGFSSGIYFYRLTTPEFSDVKKCILLK
jgi:hypothetical protein